MRVASILLAAGGSTRLGSPKQLLTYQGQTLLRRAAGAVLETGCHPVVAVLGAKADETRIELAGLDIAIVENPAWERGMGSSLKLGLQALAGHALDGVLLTLCDQPLVGAPQLRALLATFATPCPLVAAGYGGTVGVPAVFGSQYFAQLLALPDAAGAKQLLVSHRKELTTCAMPEAAVDIDTREQFQNFLLLPSLL